MASLAPAERFDMGRVVNRSVGVIGRNAVLFLMLAVLLTLVPGLLMRLLTGDTLRTPGGTNYWAVAGVSFIVSIFLSYLLQASVNYATVSDLDGQRPSFGKALGTGARFAVPLFFLAIVSVLCCYVGLILLVVPGVILFLMWCVATPAMVNEGLGVFASLGRSRALTTGHRWAILGLLTVAALLTFVPAMLVPVLGGAFSNPAAYAASPLGVPQVISTVLSMIVGVVFAVLIASIYVELRAIKEGATPQSLAEIFA